MFTDTRTQESLHVCDVSSAVTAPKLANLTLALFFSCLVLEDFHFTTVAVVKESFPGTLEALRGKKFCHPGFSKSQLWTDRVLKHFERVVLNRSSTVGCDKSLRTAAEDELSALSTFFTSACRPGEWVVDNRLDKKLKQQYSKLCELCDSKNGCSHNAERDGNQYSALDCLTKKGGDVVYEAYSYVQKYFGLVGGSARSNPENYRYLCPNGSIEHISMTVKPCTWIQQPWKSIIVKDNETAPGLMSTLEVWLPTNLRLKRSSKWVDTLRIMITGNGNKLVIRANKESLRSFILRGREIPEPGTTLPCHEPVKWCTTSDIENNKCEWLRQAAIIQGIVPELQCVQGTSQLDCFKKIKNKDADIVGTSSNLGPIATHFSNLTTVMYQETIQDGHFKIVAVVNLNLTASNMSELENKKACFPEFAGLAWVAFVEAIRNSSDSESKVCPYDESMGTFFASVCAPGSKNQLHSSVDTDLCALCKEASSGSSYIPFFDEETCAATIRNKFYDNVGALRCLASGVADVAFINSYNLSVNLQDTMLPKDFAQKYRIMCRNGTKVPLTAIPDDDCALAVVTGGEVVARRNQSRTESRDLSLTLLELDEWFGYTSGYFANIFNLYKPFNNTEDLLFRRETLGFLKRSEAMESESTEAYEKLKRNAEKCVHPKKGSGANGTEAETTVLLLMMILSLGVILRTNSVFFQV
ncbi:transferrin-like isoform X3 [Zootermopsis nevadensis]|uniref:transferrin-like isoform X3 n=1 Tax=Zootermopsis nevadensis TaxID=136037 RepID=UPI000B8EC91B|nr:transferrin-like isoform X3 [Zootermopsis nevadensis]